MCFYFAAKPYFSRIEDHISEETNTYVDGLALPSMGSPARSSPHSQGSEVTERFSRKVFVGGLPPDIDEGKIFIKDDLTLTFKIFIHLSHNVFRFFFFFFRLDEITTSFRRFGPLVVDWPHKAESKSYFPPKGYAFLLFQVNIKYFARKAIFAIKLL